MNGVYLVGFLVASKVVASELPEEQPKTRNKLLDYELLFSTT